jgi:hypothetical protein
MKLPNAESAIVDRDKLAESCLNPDHPRGRHKARVFRSALGIGRNDVEWLRERILEAIATAEARPGKSDVFGQRYVVEFPIEGLSGPETIRSIWIVLSGEDALRLVTCFVAS